MGTTESSSSASSRAGVWVFSVASDYHTTSRHQRKHKGLALCHRVILDSSAGPGKDTHGTREARTREGRGWPDNKSQRTTRRQNDNTTKTGPSQTCETTTRC